MAKWTDYTTDTNPSDNDEVMTLDADKSPKANKRVTLSTLADYFLDKLASKVFAKLETQNKTVIGALNELNSKAQTLTYIECRIDAPAGANIIKDNMIISGGIPKNNGYIPVVIGHSSTNDCADHIFCDDGSTWIIKTNVSQRIAIRFYKCTK